MLFLRKENEGEIHFHSGKVVKLTKEEKEDLEHYMRVI
jgi:hypothetical protein